ncbi:MAG: 16S rRNA (guanine(966)-N(2))-methyltransferase RsmD [Pseudomonadales bacterium]
MTKARNKRPGKNTSNQLRIIGGKWRGRKLPFPSIEGLRPTPDRVRETVFNWLAAVIPNARCLDLFTGSGALGLEALSRGAAHADLVDASPEAIQQLRQNLKLLKAEHGEAWSEAAQHWLARFNHQQHDPYDVIFLDPPFHSNLVETCISSINERQLLAKQAWIYLEMGADEPLPNIPANWYLHREKKAGQICYRLFIAENC